MPQAGNPGYHLLVPHSSYILQFVSCTSLSSQSLSLFSVFFCIISTSPLSWTNICIFRSQTFILICPAVECSLSSKCLLFDVLYKNTSRKNWILQTLLIFYMQFIKDHTVPGRNSMGALATVFPQFGFMPLKNWYALQPQWPWCHTLTAPADLGFFSSASFLSTRFLDTGVFYWNSEFLLGIIKWNYSHITSAGFDFEPVMNRWKTGLFNIDSLTQI